MRFLILLSFIILEVNASTIELSCTHPAICNLVHQQIKIKKSVLIKNILNSSEMLNTHFYKLSTKDAKQILSTKVLLAPPRDVQKKVYKLSRKRQGPTYFIKFNRDIARITRAHFWLNPYTLCEATQQIRRHLTSLNIPINKNVCESRLIEQKFAAIAKHLQQRKIGLIFGHASVASLCGKYSVNCMALQSHDHAENNTRNMKEISNALNARKAIYIAEPMTSIPRSLASLFKKYPPTTIKWNPIGNEKSQPLEDLINLLEGVLK